MVSDLSSMPMLEWIAESLNAARFESFFILLNAGPSQLEDFLRGRGFEVFRLSLPSKRQIPCSAVSLFTIFRRLRPHVVHTHLFIGSLVGLLAARLAGVTKRIYTRHYASMHHVYHPRAVLVDRLINWLATDIVCSSSVVEGVLFDLEGVPASKLHRIPHGFRLDLFSDVPTARVEALREKYGLGERSPVIGCIARFQELKGIQYVVPAFQELLESYPRAVLVLGNTIGNYEMEIRRLLKGIPAGCVVEIPFEPDVYALYRLFDVFVHVPVGATLEAFGLVYVEALAAGVPSVFTMSGIAREFIVSGSNAVVVGYRDVDGIVSAVRTLLEDRRLAGRLSAQGRRDVAKRFELAPMIERLEKLYGG